MANKTMKRYFLTKYDESVELGTFEVFRKPSMTEPDNAMSIPEIIARFTRGYGIEVSQRPWETGSAFEGEVPEEFFDEFQQEQPAEKPAEQQQQQPAEKPAEQQQQPAEKPAEQPPQEGN